MRDLPAYLSLLGVSHRRGSVYGRRLAGSGGGPGDLAHPRLGERAERAAVDGDRLYGGRRRGDADSGEAELHAHRLSVPSYRLCFGDVLRGGVQLACLWRDVAGQAVAAALRRA